MSRDDKRALAIMEESLKKVNRHYQVALPWKNNSPNLPQNREMAERRLKGLQKKLLASPALCKQYREKMSDYVENGYASVVPVDAPAVRGKIFYIPHFCTSVLTKFRVVFDCSAMFDGVLLNDELLQGPDLVTGLLGDLIRFRQEAIAVVGDIKSCFHQVFVDENDRDAFRFLWFPNNDLEQPPADYKMNVHIFGATSSPSIAAFALRRTALDNETGAGLATVETAQKHICG